MHGGVLERFRAGPAQFMADFDVLGVYAVTIWALIAPVLIATIYSISRPNIERLSNQITRTRHAA